MSLQMLIHRIEGILAILDENELEDEISDALFALEDVNARTYYDFETRGKATIDRAVQKIMAKTRRYLASPY